MTKREMFAELRLLAVAAGKVDLVAGIDHEVELLNRKNSAERGPTANQLENKAIKAFLKAHMVAGTRYTVTELIKQVFGGTQYSELSVSRATAILTQMVEAGDVVRTVEKRKAYYSVVAE